MKTYTELEVRRLLERATDEICKTMKKNWRVTEVTSAEDVFEIALYHDKKDAWEIVHVTNTPEPEVTCIYTGRVRVGTYNEEEADVVFLGETNLARCVLNDIDQHGSYLSTSYYVSDVPLSEEQLQIEFLKCLDGDATAQYAVMYSEITGYLGTEQDLTIGGHDLLAELRSYEGKYVWLKIGYNRNTAMPYSKNFL